MTNLKEKKAHVIVISNEKGGTGKSTISMHLAIKLMMEGFSVATIDMDGRQGTLSKYLENRQSFCLKNRISLPIPVHYKFAPQEDYSLIAADRSNVHFQISKLINNYDAIVIDTPGNKNYLFEEAHQFADTLITPISDSLIDLNVLADIDFETGKVKQPAHYANYIWEVKKYLASEGKAYLNWIVVGNKLSSLKSKNKQIVFDYLEKMSKLYGFRLAESIKDRVIYKELFLEGLTVLDMRHESLRYKMSVSHIAAKREIRTLAESICPE